MRYVDENILSFLDIQNTMDQNSTEIPAFVITITYIYSLFLILWLYYILKYIFPSKFGITKGEKYSAILF